MTDIIIIGVLVVIGIIGVRSTVKHFKGEGGCCGGGSSAKVKRKKLNQVVKQRTILIDGMTCDHCRNRVESRLNEMDGVSAKVNLKKKIAIVSLGKDISDEELCEAVEKAGYTVKGIQ